MGERERKDRAIERERQTDRQPDRQRGGGQKKKKYQNKIEGNTTHRY